MKVSRVVKIYNEQDLDGFFRERAYLVEASRLQREIDQKIAKCLRHLERDYQKRLQYCWTLINSAITEYKTKEKNPAKARVQSYVRLLNEGSQWIHFSKEKPAEWCYFQLAGILLNELNATDEHHNQGWFSANTVSTLAEAYMRIFHSIGVDPADPLVIACQKKDISLQYDLFNKRFPLVQLEKPKQEAKDLKHA
jgi:hypothetical protein